MAKKSDDAMDFKKAVPENYMGLVKAILDLKEHGGRFSKRFFWNVGRHVSKLKEESHGEKYNRKNVEQLAEDVEFEPPTLYGYSMVYTAYSNDKSFARVLGRDKVLASMLVQLAQLPTDTMRDQLERRIQNAKGGMTYLEVRRLVKKMTGKETNKVDGRTDDPAKLYNRISEIIDKTSTKVREPYTLLVQLDTALTKKRDKGTDIPADVIKNRKKAESALDELDRVTHKCREFMKRNKF